MNRHTMIALGAATALALLVITVAYFKMGNRWGVYGIAALYTGGIYLIGGVTGVCFPKLRRAAVGVLLAGLLTLLLGASICSGAVRL